MASGGGGGSGGGDDGSSTGLPGMKRKASPGGRWDHMMPERRGPRRGLGVAALESMVAQLETSKIFYRLPTLPPPPPLALPPTLIGRDPGVRFNPFAGDQVLGRDYEQYRGAGQQYHTSDAFARIMQAPSGYVVPRQNHHQVDRNVGVTIAAPPLLLEQHDHHHQMHTQNYSLMEQAKAYWQHSLPEHGHHHPQAQPPQHPLLEHDHHYQMQAHKHLLLEHDHHHRQAQAHQHPLLEHDHHHRQAQAHQHPLLEHDHHHRQAQALQHPLLELDHHGQAQTQYHPLMEYDHHQAQYHPLQEHVQPHHGEMRRPQVTFVDLIDSDDEDKAAGGGEELDLDLRL